MLPESLRNIPADTPEWRRVIDGVSNPQDQLPATLRGRAEFERRTEPIHGAIARGFWDRLLSGKV
jgi:hypothetical protein